MSNSIARTRNPRGSSSRSSGRGDIRARVLSRHFDHVSVEVGVGDLADDVDRDVAEHAAAVRGQARDPRGEHRAGVVRQQRGGADLLDRLDGRRGESVVRLGQRDLRAVFAQRVNRLGERDKRELLLGLVDPRVRKSY